MSSINHKIVFLGESAVGKSSLVIRFVNGKFSPSQEPTVGAAFLTKKITIKNVNYKLQIWDTAGQERYHSLAPMYYRGAGAAFIIYDITSYDTFEKSKKWIEELKKLGDPDVRIALVGNKIDLVEERVIEKEKGQEYAEKNGLMFFETSAKTSENVDKLFIEMTQQLQSSKKLKKKINQDFSDSSDEGSITLSKATNSSNNKSGCC
ncbi:ras-related protein rab-5c [Anaeramoeba flamelloides]|uniref:Ras-related protein rab-5c n=1 Tax=Anaeramoeba flamelloides TaxID=1746091 RepID=A0AAV8ADK4_9EUKA|nr:ras-related protein rab-5c [Anaeramoeba flamelloides]KAJ6250960.1 ras-related protein rab-5c [Anaeramoeba flamelloides]